MEKKTENKDLPVIDDTHLDAESVMLTLDQLSQTIEVMNNVVRRLKRYVEDQSSGSQFEHASQLKHENQLAHPGQLNSKAQPRASATRRVHDAQEQVLQRHLQMKMSRRKLVH